MKTLFLDIDEVLNTPEFVRRTKLHICPERAQVLVKICRDSFCRIIISSAWQSDMPRLLTALQEAGAGLVVDHIIGTTGYCGAGEGRVDAINRQIELLDLPREKCIALDDCPYVGSMDIGLRVERGGLNDGHYDEIFRRWHEFREVSLNDILSSKTIGYEGFWYVEEFLNDAFRTHLDTDIESIPCLHVHKKQYTGDGYRGIGIYVIDYLAVPVGVLIRSGRSGENTDSYVLNAKMTLALLAEVMPLPTEHPRSFVVGDYHGGYEIELHQFDNCSRISSSKRADARKKNES